MQQNVKNGFSSLECQIFFFFNNHAGYIGAHRIKDFIKFVFVANLFNSMCFCNPLRLISFHPSMDMVELDRSTSIPFGPQKGILCEPVDLMVHKPVNFLVQEPIYLLNKNQFQRKYVYGGWTLIPSTRILP